MPDDVPIEEAPRRSASDTLIKAIERAEEMDDVIVFWRTKNDDYGSMDNELTVAETLFMLELLKHWIMQKILPHKSEE